MIKSLLICLLAGALTLAFCEKGAFAQTSNSRCASEVERLFERDKDSGENSLFVVDDNHRLQATYDATCHLTAIRVGKRWDWYPPKLPVSQDSPDLDEKTYRRIDDKITTIQALGASRGSDKVAWTSHSNAFAWTAYENGFVETESYLVAMVPFVVSFRILYPHDVSGRLTKKFMDDDPRFALKVQLVIDGKPFYSDTKTFDRFEVGDSGIFRVYGEKIGSNRQ